MDLNRSVSTLRLRLSREPRSKRVKGKAGAQELRDLMFQGAASWHRMDGALGRWPQSRAHLALDIEFNTTRRNSPRIDKLCKWLLDELGGAHGAPIVYNDDRQVKMLFARHLRDADTPMISVTAQTVAQVGAGLRRAASFDTQWTIEHANWEMSLHLGLDEDLNPDFLREFGIDPPADGELTLREQVRFRLRRQATNLAVTDELSSSAMFTYAAERHRKEAGLPATSDALHRLLDYGLAVDLGPLPSRSGESADFCARTTTKLSDLVADKRWITPLLPSVGVTLFYLETGAGKDLDNIFLTILPVILETFRPPVASLADYSPIDDLQTWHVDAERGARTTIGDTAFIEAVSLQGISSERLSPGTIVLALSHGGRMESWWDSALRFVEEHNDNMPLTDDGL
ncbi:hypothetical protein ACIHDR_43105 [Nocardia sp. NPDC052278]|uniref:hypothetical protein n=1 Tax=unclassified Nocardia TaxID=2637762 RepID=UPI0036830A36